MAKNYLCKDCQYNNNGWCDKRKIQGLKTITECEFKDKIVMGELKDLKITNKEYIETPRTESIGDLKDSYKVFGARELFYNIQRQMLAIEQQEKAGIVKDKYQALKDTMVRLETKLIIDENIFSIAIDYGVDENLVENSKDISKMWGEK